MTLTFRDAVTFASGRRVVLPTEYYGRLQGQQRALAFSIAGVAQRDQLQGVLDSLNQVLSKGMTFAEWKASVKGGQIGLGLPNHRLDNIFRTNLQTAYSSGHYKQQQGNKQNRPYLMYDAVNDSRTRPSHLRLDNVIRPIDDPFWATYTPPNGYRCRCSTIALTEAQARARGGVPDDPEGGWPEPDKGWSYNPGENPEQGVSQAMKPQPGGSAQLQQAMEDAIDNSDSTATDLIHVLEGTRSGTLSQALAKVEAAKEAALEDEDAALSLARLSALTDEQQAFLRVVSDEARPMRSVALDLPPALGLRGDAGSAANRLSEDVFSQFGIEDAPTLYRIPPTGFKAEVGDVITLQGVASVSSQSPSGVHELMVFEAGRSSAIPVSAISAHPHELEWIYPPNAEFEITRIEGTIIHLKEMVDAN